jgi:hypothetical protein
MTKDAQVKCGYRILLQDYPRDSVEPSDVRVRYAAALAQEPVKLAAVFDVMKALPWWRGW